MIFFIFLVLIPFFNINSDRIISDGIEKVINKKWLELNKNNNLCAVLLTKAKNNIYEGKAIKKGKEVDIKIDINDIQKLKIDDTEVDFRDYSCALFKIEIQISDTISEKLYLYLNDLNSIKDKESYVGFLNNNIISFNVICYKGGKEYKWYNAAKLFFMCDNLLNVDFGNFTYIFKDLSDMFTGCSVLKKIDISSLINENIEYLNALFFMCSQLEVITFLKEKCNTIKLKNISYMFASCINLKEINGIKFLDTKNVTDMSGTFNFCYNLKVIDLDGWDTENVEDMNNLFGYAENIEEINGTKNWNTKNLKNAKEAFSGLKHLKTLDLRNFKFDNLESKNTKLIAYCNIDSLIIDNKNFKKKGISCNDCNIKNISYFDDENNLNDIKNIDEKDCINAILMCPDVYSHARDFMRHEMYKKESKEVDKNEQSNKNSNIDQPKGCCSCCGPNGCCKSCKK